MEGSSMKKDAGLTSKSLSQNIKEKSESFAKYGGFDLLESTIEGVQNLNPDRKARRNIFLTEKNKKNERAELLKVLELWKNLLKNKGDVIDLVNIANEKSIEAEKVLKKILKKLWTKPENWKSHTEP